jgi:hypothetical protein
MARVYKFSAHINLSRTGEEYVNFKPLLTTCPPAMRAAVEAAAALNVVKAAHGRADVEVTSRGPNRGFVVVVKDIYGDVI